MGGMKPLEDTIMLNPTPEQKLFKYLRDFLLQNGCVMTFEGEAEIRDEIRKCTDAVRTQKKHGRNKQPRKDNMKELQELLRLMKSDDAGRLCGYGAIMEYVRDRIKELRRQQRNKSVRNKQPRTPAI